MDVEHSGIIDDARLVDRNSRGAGARGRQMVTRPSPTVCRAKALLGWEEVDREHPAGAARPPPSWERRVVYRPTEWRATAILGPGEVDREDPAVSSRVVSRLTDRARALLGRVPV